ncbi:MAG: hypothetical protein JZU58_09295 [Curvibacter lanceolatus]|uniref:HEPN domain-containing protein n=1 Tax=Curvibacter lanceolatus TaxID=86182 RepID=UPI002357C3CF|nr:HEPN domain-containing protein [Curvibacter lanceolatus]MBV5292536.1 hypothetical protein [Curvibacter lanceolatus]
MYSRGIAFVTSSLSVVGGSCVNLMENVNFRAANDLEIDHIKSVIASSIPEFIHKFPNPYETQRIEIPDGPAYSIEYHYLPRTEWKYWVVDFIAGNGTIFDLDVIAQVLPFPFKIGFMSLYADNSSVLGSGGRVQLVHGLNELQSMFHPGVREIVVNVDQISSLSSLYKRFCSIKEGFEFVRSAVENFSALRGIPFGSDLIVVGLFSIIESLVTHAPRSNETLDSVTHQIVNKIALLKRMYESPVSASVYFDADAKEDVIWKKLYRYRSSVAHGTPVVWDAGDFLILKNRYLVIDFLFYNVRELIKLGLSDPDFLSDLRKC